MIRPVCAARYWALQIANSPYRLQCCEIALLSIFMPFLAQLTGGGWFEMWCSAY
jgi:hypothetical protein